MLLARSYTCPINLIFVVSLLIALASIRALNELRGCLYQCRDVCEEKLNKGCMKCGWVSRLESSYCPTIIISVEILPEHHFCDNRVGLSFYSCRTLAAVGVLSWGGRGMSKSSRFFWAVGKPCLYLEGDFLMCSFWIFIPVKCACLRSCHSPLSQDFAYLFPVMWKCH